MTIKEMINISSKEIGHIEATMLMEYALGVDKQYLIINADKNLNEIDNTHLKEIIKQSKNATIKDKKSFEEIYIEYVKQIEQGTPLQYITNTQEFMGLKFYVDENVLIPQPDTEVLVEETIKQINKLLEQKTEIRILDLCTGSGAIAISLAKYIKNLQNKNNNDLIKKNDICKKTEITASDISNKALEIAKKNYKRLIEEKEFSNKIENKKENIIKIEFIKSDMFEKIEGKFDIIVSNPPYIKTNVISTLDKEVQNEPKIALDGGEDGLKFYKIIRENINQYIKKDGKLLMEIGYEQKEELLKLFEGAECIKDFAGNDRVIVWKK